MVKWKSISKKLFMMILSVMLIFSTQLTAFAYTDTTAESAVSEEKESETEEVLEENHTDDTFSVAGNGEMLDYISNDSSKEFLTITTKNNNTFYIVIDRSSTTDNVYMLSQIDENDLKEFVDAEEEETDNSAATVMLDETEAEENTAEVVVDETEEENSVTSNKGGMLAILAVATVGVAGYYYFKFRKDNQDDDDTPDEGMEVPGTEEEKTVNEDDEAEQEAESQK